MLPRRRPGLLAGRTSAPPTAAGRDGAHRPRPVKDACARSGPSSVSWWASNSLRTASGGWPRSSRHEGGCSAVFALDQHGPARVDLDVAGHAADQMAAQPAMATGGEDDEARVVVVGGI